MLHLAYRNFTPNDIDELVLFWNAQAEWDQINRDTWEHRFLKSPYGAPVIILAVHEEQLVGQFAFLPMGVQVDKKEVVSYRPFAIIISKQARAALGFLGLTNAILKMYNTAIPFIKEKGGSLVHALPNPGWAKAFRLLPNLQVHYFLLWSMPLKEMLPLPEAYTAIRMDATDSRIEYLWQQHHQHMGCGVVRSAAMLQWKTWGEKYIFLGLVKKGSLIGLSVSIPKPGDKQWLICDVLTNDVGESLSLLLKATCHLAQQQALEQNKIQKLAILAAPLLQPVLAALGFREDTYRFPVIVHLLDGSLTNAQVAPVRWYVSAND